MEILWKYDGNIMEILWKYYGNIMEILWKYDGNMMRPSLFLPRNLTKQCVITSSQRKYDRNNMEI